MVCGIPGTQRSRNLNKEYLDQPRYNILLTNGRFPVSLDLARQLYWAGHHVHCVDPMEYHVCKFSIAVDKSRQVPAPIENAQGYIDGVRKVIDKWNIDLIIPVHEEIFYLAECGDEEILKRLLAPPWEVLVRLHNKWEFSKMMRRFGLDVPEAHLCKSKEDIKNLDLSREWAVKPVFGRASGNVYHLKPGKDVPEDIDVSEKNHYIAQEWLKGNRYCSYSVIREGRVQAHGLYPVEDTIDGSSSVYFRNTDHDGIKAYLDKIAAKLPNVTAQLAFDFIEIGGRLVTMECNPRATSGLHLWSNTPYLARALTNTLSQTTKDDYTSPPRTNTGNQPRRQLAPGMMMWEHKKAGVKVWAKHMGRLMGSRDVMWKWRDIGPVLMQPFLLTAYYKICQEKKLDLPDMFQYDVTWEPDGEHLEKVRKLIEEADERDGEEKGKPGNRDQKDDQESTRSNSYATAGDDSDKGQDSTPSEIYLDYHGDAVPQ